VYGEFTCYIFGNAQTDDSLRVAIDRELVSKYLQDLVHEFAVADILLRTL